MLSSGTSRCRFLFSITQSVLIQAGESKWAAYLLLRGALEPQPCECGPAL
jgi:hypothetical protein